MENRDFVIFRRGTPDDSYAVFEIFEFTLADLMKRMGSSTPTSASDPEALQRMWDSRKSLYHHLAASADQFWIAEVNGQVVGFSRSIQRDGLRQLTELFVRPGQQSAGLGRQLIDHAFPPGDEKFRSIIATTDFRAQALYLKSGVYPRFPIYYFGCLPEVIEIQTELEFEKVSDDPETLRILSGIDQEILGFRREIDHRWFISDRQGFLYRRKGVPVGYGYFGDHGNGPFALLDPGDFTMALAHAENAAAVSGKEHFGVEVPMVNQAAVDFLISRNYRLDTFMAVMMTSVPIGKFEKYILPSPPFFI